jgi:hypothetical protein
MKVNAPTAAPTPTPMAPPAPQQAPTPSAPSRNFTSRGPARAPNAQAKFERIQSKQPANVPDEQISLDDGDLGYSEPAAPTRTEQGSRRSKEIPIDGVKFPVLDADTLKGDRKAPKDNSKEDTAEGGGDLAPDNDTDDNDLKPEPKKTLEDDLGEPGQDDGDETPAPAAPAKKGSRDYSKFRDPEMLEIARALPNHLFAKFEQLAPKYQAAMEELPKLRDAASKIPSFHYEHPDGYLLSPEWPKVTDAFHAYEHEVSHHERQLAAIENGEPWKEFMGYDDKGAPQYKVVPAPENGRVDIQSKIAVQKALNRAQSQLDSVQSKAHELITSYQTKRKQSLQAVEEHQKKMFPTVDPAKLTGDDAENYKLAGDMIAEIDPSFAKHPATEFTKRLYVITQRIARQGVKWKQELDRAKSNAAGKARSQNTRIPAAGERDNEADDMIPIEHE